MIAFGIRQTVDWIAFLERENLICFLIKKQIKFSLSKAPILPSRKLSGFDRFLGEKTTNSESLNVELINFWGSNKLDVKNQSTS